MSANASSLRETLFVAIIILRSAIALNFLIDLATTLLSPRSQLA
ncbi:MAG: hypothetical protein V7L25_17315 [Nostoc sp.]